MVAPAQPAQPAPALSFVVCAFERPTSLRTCLSSLLDQAPTIPIEILVCDNSPDLTVANQNRELCRLLDPRIRYEWTSDRTQIPPLLAASVRHQRCLYTALEIGIALATGEWIVACAQDSYYTPVFAYRMLTLARASDWEFIYCDFLLGGPSHAYYGGVAGPRNCNCDLGCLMFKRAWFEGYADKWKNYELADGLFAESLVARGIRHGRMDQVLFCHN